LSISADRGVSLYLALLPLCACAESMSVTVISFDSSERIEFERHRAAVSIRLKASRDSYDFVDEPAGMVQTLARCFEHKIGFQFEAPQKHCRSLGDDHHKTIGTNDIANVIVASCRPHLIRDMFPRIGFVVSSLLSDCFRFLCNFQYSVSITSFCMLFPGDSHMVNCTLGGRFNGFGGLQQIVNE
jgi:hypothetical protein